MILAEVRQFLLRAGPKQLEQFPRRDFVGRGARTSVRRRKNRGDHAVAPREQPATFDVRLAPRVREHFFQNFRGALGRNRPCARVYLKPHGRIRIGRDYAGDAAGDQAVTFRLPALDGTAVLEAPFDPAVRKPPIC